jgi:hypothetical protein
MVTACRFGILLLLLAACRASPTVSTAGFYFAERSFTLPAEATAGLGGPLTDVEMTSIRQMSRLELERAFAGLRIAVTEDRRAFYRVEVVPTLRPRGPLPNSGESLALGFLGGAGAVGFDIVALKAVQYAPRGASRQAMIEGIGRGVGRVAAHEFAHEILGAVPMHNDMDESSYEYPTPDRAAQYYGDLHWTTAGPLLQQKLGR